MLHTQSLWENSWAEKGLHHVFGVCHNSVSDMHDDETIVIWRL